MVDDEGLALFVSVRRTRAVVPEHFREHREAVGTG